MSATMSNLTSTHLLAQLPAFAAAIVWLIVLGGLGMFIWRRIQGVPLRRRPRRPGRTGRAATARAAGTAAVVPTPVRPGHPDRAVLPATVVPDGPDTPSSPSSSAPAAPAAGSASRSGFFAPSATPADPSRPDNDGRATVGEAVRGIVMPCGLTPVIDGSAIDPEPVPGRIPDHHR